MFVKKVLCCVIVTLWVASQSVSVFAHFSNASGHSHYSPSLTMLGPELASQHHTEEHHHAPYHGMSEEAHTSADTPLDRQQHANSDSCCDVTCSVGQALIDCTDAIGELSGKTSIDPADVLSGELVGFQTPPPNATT